MIKPLGDRVLVRQDEAEETTASGIFIASTAKERPQTGVVLATGEGKMKTNGELVPVPVNVGDRVCYSMFGATEVSVDGEKLLIMRVDDIFGVYVD